MATELSNKNTEETDNPGQKDYDDLVRRENHATDYHRRQSTPANDPSDPRDYYQRQETAAGDPSDPRDDIKQREEAPDEEHPNTVGKGYKKTTSTGRIQQFRKRKGLIVGFAGLLSAVVAIAILFFSFLNVFKLDDMMSNVDAKTFARLNGVEDRRSMAWMQAYLRMRLADIGDHPNLDQGVDSDNQFFRSEKIHDNPVTDWYRTLRTSKFEQDVFENHGFKFVSVRTADGKIRPGKITLNNETLLNLNVSDADWDGLANGDTATIRKYNSLVDISRFNNDKQARIAIKKAVNDETHMYQVFKRRHLRKDIQNMTGVRNWRFFDLFGEKGSNAAQDFDEKRLAIRNKIIDKATPESTKSGKFIRCLFGISDCKFSEDPRDPSNSADGTISGNDDRRAGENVTEVDPDTGDTRTEEVDLGPLKESVSNVVNKLNVALTALNIVQILDSLSRINTAIHNGELSKGVAVAKGVQAMALYQVFETSRDQVKTGEVTGEELDQFMQTIGPIAAGEGWTKVIAGNGDPSKLTQTAEAKKYCSHENQDAIENSVNKANSQFAYLCADKQIGGSSTAERLEDGWNRTVGKVVTPLLNAYGSVRHIPIIGDVLDFANKAIGTITGALTDAAIATLGLGNEVAKVMAWVTSHVASFLGAGPIVRVNEPAAGYMNWLVQGGAYTAEASGRSQGASKTTVESRVQAQLALAEYQTDKQAQMSSFDRYLSLSNPDSVAAKQLFAVSQMNKSEILNKLTNFRSIFGNIGKALTLPFTKHTQAASDTGYEGSDFAAIPTYDFPKECFELDPITAEPSTGTNIQDILGKSKVPDSDLTWDLVNDKDRWYEYVYDKIGDKKDADEIAVKIYNCNLLDTSMRGSIGYLYDYTDDNGLEDSGSSDASGGSSTGNVSGDVKELAQKLLDNPNVTYPYTDTGGITVKDVLKEVASTGEGIVNSPDVSFNRIPINTNLLRALVEYAETHSIGLNALSNANHSSTSNHYKGMAIDIACSPALNRSAFDRIAAKYGGKNNGEVCPGNEHWHYDFLR